MPDIVVLFFALGIIAGIAKSDLKVPEATYDTLSILLMLIIGLKGGIALYGNLTWGLVPELIAVAATGAIIPLILYPLLRFWVQLNISNSASIAAHYGSVSAGTFAVGITYVEAQGITMAPQATLYLVLLELPAIMVAIFLHRRLTGNNADNVSLLHEVFTSRGVILMAGGVVIGALYGPQGMEPISPLLDVFKILLAVFLLDMGLSAAKHLNPLPWEHWRLFIFAALAPLLLALLGMVAGKLLGLSLGTTLILATLTASASYIAAPAAIRSAIKDADIGLAIFAALGITFPLNILIGIPLYHQILKHFIE